VSYETFDVIDAILLVIGLFSFVKDRSIGAQMELLNEGLGPREQEFFECEHCGCVFLGDEKMRMHKSSAQSPCHSWARYIAREQGEPPSTGEHPEVLVITWNTHLSEDGVVNGVPQIPRLSHAMIAFRVAELILEESRPKVLTLQEVRDPSEMAKLMKKLHFTLVGASQSFCMPQESWTCLFTRGIDSQKVKLVHFDDPTKHGGVCVAELASPRCTLVTAHFAAGHTKPNSRVGVQWIGVDVRKEQSAGIRRYLESRSDQTCPVICFGDFNFGKDESLGDVKGLGPWHEAMTGPTLLAVPPLEGNQRQRYDRVYVAGDNNIKINKAWTNQMWSVSDHAAVLALVGLG